MLGVIYLSTSQTFELQSLNEKASISGGSIALDLRRTVKTLESAQVLPRLGFQNVRANITFLQFLQYFGDDRARQNSGNALSDSFFRSIIEDDPFYREFYIFLTGSVSLNAAMPHRSVELMEKGLAALSPHQPDDSYYVWRYKAVDELLFLGDSKAAERSFETAAAWANESSLPDSVSIASISQQTANFLKENPESKAAQVGAWSSILSTAVDSDTRNRAISNIQELGGEIVIGEDGRVTIKYARTGQDSED